MNLASMTIAQVQSHFVSPLSPADIVHYQARLDVARGVEWKDRAFYAIGDAEESPGSYALYQSHIEDGVVYLGKEDACGDIDNFEPAYFVLYKGCAVIPQF